jgi:hypothetical protein
VEPMVTVCGHTFCHFCIGEWAADEERRNCPICRKRINPFGPPQHHIQMEHFVENIYAFLSGPAASNRSALIADRAQLAAARPHSFFAEIAAENGPPPSGPGESGSSPATNNDGNASGGGNNSEGTSSGVVSPPPAPGPADSAQGRPNNANSGSQQEQVCRKEGTDEGKVWV